MEEVRNLRCGVVTLLCQDYGMIDDDVYFTTGEVLGGVPLRVGDAVNGLAVRDSAQGGWKALRVRHFDQDLTLTSMVLLSTKMRPGWVILFKLVSYFVSWPLLQLPGEMTRARPM